jgi:hypothetical protein
VSFEIERFEWTAGDRLELAGRWFDVRGRRFLRPTLDLEVDGRTRRVLASLEHKPWIADEGEVWHAAFAWDGEMANVDAVQLTVGPDLVVELEPPATAADLRSHGRKAVGRELAAARAEAKRLRAELERERERLQAAVDDLRSRLADAEEDARAQTTELREGDERASAAEAAAVQRHQQLERERDAALAERGTLATELENSRRAAEEAGARIRSVQTELAAAARARDRAREERNSWLSRARDAAAERDAALASRQTAVTERDSALAERDAAFADRDAALAERDAAAAERKAARADREASGRELEAARADREAARDAMKADRETARTAPIRSAPPAAASPERAAPASASPQRAAPASASPQRAAPATFPAGVPEPGARHIPGTPIQPGLTTPDSTRRWVPIVAALAALLLVAAVIILLVT